MTYDASDRRHVRQNAKQSKFSEGQRMEIMRGLMSLPAGRTWMYDKLCACHIFQSTFSGNALHGAFNEGERNVGLQLLNDIMQACPDLYVIMTREANERNIVADVRRSRADDPAAVGNGGYTTSEHDDFDADDAAI